MAQQDFKALPEPCHLHQEAEPTSPLKSGQDFGILPTDGMWQKQHHGASRARS